MDLVQKGPKTPLRNSKMIPYVMSCSFVKLLHFSRKKYFEGRLFQGKRPLVLYFILPFIRHLETIAAATTLDLPTTEGKIE